MASASASSSRQWELPDTPTGVTGVHFSRGAATSSSSSPPSSSSAAAASPSSSGSDNLLLVSGWDGAVKCYDVKAASCVWSHADTFPQDPDAGPAGVLCCGFGADAQRVYIGGVNRAVSALAVGPDGAVTASTLGEHAKEVKEVHWNAATGTVMSAGWDNKLRSWDPRAATPLAAACDLPGKAFTMDVSARNVVVGCSQRKVAIFDVRKLDAPLNVSSSTLKHQTRVLRCMPNGEGYALGTVEGRIAIEYIDMQTHNSKTYSFKCHRVKDKDQGTETVYPVNAIAFHPGHGTFATGGCDGHVFTWDGAAKKRLAHYSQYPTSIAGMDFNADGSLLAIASSYTFEQGELETPPPEQIFVRSVLEAEVAPRKRGSKRKKRG